MTFDEYAKVDDVYAAIGRITTRFTLLEEQIEHCLNLIKRFLPEGSEVHKLRRHHGFSSKLDILEKYAIWYFERIGEKSHYGDQLKVFVGACRKLAIERNIYVHAALHETDPRKAGSIGDEFSPVLQHPARDATLASQVTLRPVTGEVLNEMLVLADRILDARDEAYASHYSIMFTDEMAIELFRSIESDLAAIKPFSWSADL